MKQATTNKKATATLGRELRRFAAAFLGGLLTAAPV